MKTKLALLAGILACTMPAQANTSPSSMLVGIFEMRVSTNSNCTPTITIFKTGTPTPVDFDQNPVFGSGIVTDGTYHCAMFQINDQITEIGRAS